MNFNSPRNKKMIRLLALNSLKANRLRFVISGIAIALTALLITGTFTMGLSLYETDKLQNQYRYGGRFHGAIFNASTNEIQKLINDNEFAEYGYLFSVTEYTVKNLPLELVTASANLPDLMLTKITGHMPLKYNEVAMSIGALDRFGVNHRLGESITITYNFDGIEKTEDFAISGFWPDHPDGSLLDSKVFVSSVFAGASTFDKDAMRGLLSNILFICFDKPININDRLSEIIEKAGIEAFCEANRAYEHDENNQEITVITNTMMPFSALLLIIMISAYLLIYNIFFISVTRDIRFYGLIKAIGATKKQIRRIILIQALFISLFAIPVGLILGYLLSQLVVPAFLVVNNFNVYVISSNPLIFLFASVFAFITVLLSARKPGVLAGMVSPMEAVKHTGILTSAGLKEKKTAYGAKIHIMALRNILRGKKKLLLSVISLSTGVILFCVSSSFIASFKLEKYLDNKIYGDLRINSVSFTDGDSRTRDIKFDRITLEDVNKIRRIDGVTLVEEFYCFKTEDAALGKIHGGYVDWGDGRKEEILNEVKAEILGIGSRLGDRLKVIIGQGEFDEMKFLSGDYAVISESFMSQRAINTDDTFIMQGSYYKPGDVVRVADIEKEFTVMAVINNSSFGPLGKQIFVTDNYELYVPAEAIGDSDETIIAGAVVFADDNKLSSVERNIKELLSSKQGITLTSKEIYIQEFNNLVGGMTTIAIVLSILLCIIGMTNYVNTSVTSIISRGYELSVLEGIGMTKHQLKRMIMYECLFMGSMALFISALLSYPLSSWIIGNLARDNGFVEFTYSWLPTFIWITFIGFASLITSRASYKSISHENLSARLVRD